MYDFRDGQMLYRREWGTDESLAFEMDQQTGEFKRWNNTALLAKGVYLDGAVVSYELYEQGNVVETLNP